MAKRFVLLVLSGVLIHVLACPARVSSRFRFFGEEIHIEVLEDSMEVVGIYEFRSTIDVDRRWPIFYPYAMDEYHGRARTILVEVIEEDSTHVLSFNDRRTGSSWYLDLPAKSSRKVKVVYRQKLKANTATYVLTTTRAWSTPLDYADFYVTLPPDKTEGVKLSYTPGDTTLNQDGSVTYTVRCRNLMPKKDLTVTWSGNRSPEKAAPALGED